jgi:hypothetical protein
LRQGQVTAGLRVTRRSRRSWESPPLLTGEGPYTCCLLHVQQIVCQELLSRVERKRHKGHKTLKAFLAVTTFAYRCACWEADRQR